MALRHPRGPAAWHDDVEEAPFARFFADPSENPTVRPMRVEAPREDPIEALVRAESLVLIARRSRPISP